MTHFLLTFGNLGATIQCQVVATYDTGCIIGALVSMLIGDRLSRRRCILVGCRILMSVVCCRLLPTPLPSGSNNCWPCGDGCKEWHEHHRHSHLAIGNRTSKRPWKAHRCSAGDEHLWCRAHECMTILPVNPIHRKNETN